HGDCMTVFLHVLHRDLALVDVPDAHATRPLLQARLDGVIRRLCLRRLDVRTGRASQRPCDHHRVLWHHSSTSSTATMPMFNASLRARAFALVSAMRGKWART